jgi:hypothetical protein
VGREGDWIEEAKLVLKPPGWMIRTRMPKGASSWERDSESAGLEVGY